MPILLDKPYTLPGPHGQPDSVYTMVQMIKFEVQPTEKQALIVMAYGNVVDGKFACAHDVEPRSVVLNDLPGENGITIDGKGNPVVAVVRPAVTDFSDMVAAMLIKAADDGVNYYTALGRDLYVWLINKGYYKGTIL